MMTKVQGTGDETNTLKGTGSARVVQIQDVAGYWLLETVEATLEAWTIGHVWPWSWPCDLWPY